MNSSPSNKYSRRLLATGALLCATLNFAAWGAPNILETAINPLNNHTYYLLSTSNWSDAQAAAMGMGWNLATVNDAAENAWIFGQWGATRDLWIGLYDPVLDVGGGANHAANFCWVDGSSSTYRNWRGGEPNSGNGGEYWTAIITGNNVPGGVWNDTRNVASETGSTYFGVVEAVPEPSTFALAGLGAAALLIARRRK